MPEEPEPELHINKMYGFIDVPQELLDDNWQDDIIGKILSGEITPMPIPPPSYHRCFWCWLTAKLSRKHTRCSHGYIECEHCRYDS